MALSPSEHANKRERQIERFMELKHLPVEALRRQGQFLGLDTTIPDHELIQEIVRTEDTPQEWKLPQALALRTKDNQNGKELVRQANSRILPQDSQTGRPILAKIRKKIFSFANRSGQLYEVQCPYIPAKIETVERLISMNLLVALPGQRKLMELITEYPDRFQFNFIRKQDKTKRFHLMLHCEPRNI